MDEHKTQIAQIGSTLERSRQERGLTHEDVERATKIRARYLQAMERDDYDALPGAVYARGFLKTYANYLDLDGEELVRELEGQRATPPTRPAQADGEATDNERVRGRRAVVWSGAGSSRYRGRRPRRLPVAVRIGGVLGLVVLLIAVTGLYFVGLQASQSPDEAAEAAQNAPQAQEEPAPEAAPEENASQVAGEAEAQDAEISPGEAGEVPVEEAPPELAPAEPEPVEPPALENLTMEVRVEGNISWLNISTDGNLALEQVAEPGFSQTFEAQESITVWSGNAGAVSISLNGQDYGQLGESGETRIREFTLKSAEN